ncbi:MAG: anaerobic ribonucleoside-triphosphate reductase activating protein [Eubacteriales bacterium]|nr:anaerobic ribonucleoside-triphosphate reductase activating protein [Eubacteriales bacterium]
MKIAGMVKNSFVDYPGRVACVVFVPLCNYDCFYCHNRPLIQNAPETLREEEVLAFLQKRVGMLDGVVVTGGEPTLQKDLMPFLAKIKALGYPVKLDTNGSRPAIVHQVLDAGLCDYFAVDYKAPFRQYPEICGTGADAGKVLDTIGLLINAHADFEVRTTVIPQFSRDDLLTMARELPKVPRYVLNRYRKPENYLPADEGRINQTPYTQREIEELATVVREVQPGAVG